MCVGCICTKKRKCSGWWIIPNVKRCYQCEYSNLKIPTNSIVDAKSHKKRLRFG